MGILPRIFDRAWRYLEQKLEKRKRKTEIHVAQLPAFEKCQ